MLLGNFFTIVNHHSADNSFHVTTNFNPNHPIFKGHFPHLPVVPGVCQTQMLTETLGHLLNRRVDVKRAHHIKFLALMNPEKVVELYMDIKIEKMENDLMLVSAVYSDKNEVFFRFKGELC